MMNCKQTQRSLIFRIKGSLSADQTNEMDRHISECPSCSHLFNKMQATLNLLQTERKSMNNPFFFTRVEQRVINQKEASLKRNPSFIRVLKPAILAFLIVISCFIGWAIGGSNPAEESELVSDNTEIAQMADQYHLNMSHEDVIENYYVTK